MSSKSPSENPNLEEYAAIYKKMIADSLSHFDAMKEDLLQSKKEAIDEKLAATQERNQILKNASELARIEFEKNYKQLKEELNQKLVYALVKKLIEANRSDFEISSWLEVDNAVIISAREDLGFKPFGDSYARIYFTGFGRGGVIHFQWNQKITDFHWEFAGGNSLALIFIPDESQWELATGYKQDERLPILEFIAKETIRIQASGYKYAIEGGVLRIY